LGSHGHGIAVRRLILAANAQVNLAANPRLLPAVRSSARERLALDRLVELALASPPPEASAESVPDEAGEEAAAEISPALAAEADEQATAEGQ